MKPSDRSVVAVVVSMVLATLTLRPLTQDGGIITEGWFLIILLGAVSLVLRRLNVRSGLVLAAQLVVWLGSIVVTVSRSTAYAAPSWFGHFGALVAGAVTHMQAESAPMSPDDGVRLLFVSSVSLLMIIADLLVLGVHRPALGIAPAATLFLVPALGLSTDTGVWPFLLIAVGYLAILVAEGLNASARWTRGLSYDSADQRLTADPVVWRAAGFIAVPAVVLTVILGLLLPTISLGGFGIGNGPGGNGPIQLADPTLDLKRNLTEPRNRPVLTYHTDDNRGLYIRLASLPAFSSSGWTNTQTPLQRGPLPSVPGLGTTGGKLRTTDITIVDFDSEYLPMPYAPRQFQAAGSWGVDPTSLVVISSARTARLRADATANLSYRVQSVDIDPTANDLDEAGIGTPMDSTVTTTVPRDLPPSIIDLAHRVTAKADTPAAKAAALQAFFRDHKNFTYSTQPQPGSGYQALTNFLFKDKKGYCEQFAASMAIMARVLGIPSRVAVGFLPGERNGNTWTVSVRDMHAWPELYFSGWGWVRYEPTPSLQTGAAPAWTTVGTDRTPQTSSAAPSSDASSRTVRPSSGPSDRANQPQGSTDAGTNTHPVRNLLVGAGALLALLILAAPASIRLRRRSSRFDADQQPVDQVEGAWSEVRDTVIDLGGRWPTGSPRAIGEQVGERLEPDGSKSMGRLAVLVERSRYARSFDDPVVVPRSDRHAGGAVASGSSATSTSGSGTTPSGDAEQTLTGMTTDIRRGLAERLPWHRRLRATLLPRSVFRRRH